MKLIDTHSHLYEPEFDDDREAAGSSTSAAATPNTASR